MRAHCIHSLLLVIAALAVACGSDRQSPAVPSGAAASGSTAASAAPGLPRLADVPLYRANAAGNGIQPGPGPAGKPEIVWRENVGASHMVPILVDGLLIAGTNDGRLVAFDAYTGATKWTFTAGGAIKPSLASADGLVFASDGTALHALDLATGTERWSNPVNDAVGRLNVVNGVAYVGTTGGVVGFDAQSGKEVWHWADGPADVAVGAGPIADGVGYFAAQDERVYAVDISTREVRWAIKTISKSIASGQVVGDTFYVSTNQADAPQPVGEIYAVDRASGNIRWRFRAPSGAQLKEGPSKNGVLYASGMKDGLWALRDDGSTVTVLWHVHAAESHWPMALVGDTLYEARTDGSVGAYAIADGSLLWETASEGDFTGGPIVSGGMVFLANDSRGVMALADPAMIAQLPKAAATEMPHATPATPSASGLLSLVATLEPQTTGLVRPVALAIGKDANLYVADIADVTAGVHVITPAGAPVRSWGKRGAGPGEFDFGGSRADIAVGSDGLVYVMEGGNHRVQVFKPDGTFVRQFGSYGDRPGQYLDPINIAVDTAGNVDVIDDGTQTISKVDAAGKVLWRIAGTAETDPDLKGFHHRGSFDSKGLLWITNDGNGRVVAIDGQGKKADAFGGRGSTDGLFQGTVSLAFDAAGNAFVDECSDKRLQAFDTHRQFLGAFDAPGGMPFGTAYVFGQDGLLYAIAGGDHCAGKAPSGAAAAAVLVYRVTLK